MHNYLLMMLPVVLPVVFWSAYYLQVDRQLPEPPLHLILAFMLGVLAFYVSLLMYRALGVFGLRFDAFALARNDLPGLFAYAIFVIGLIEESAKLLPFLLVVLRFTKFDEPIDGIVYASFIALGFAALENVFYVPYLDSAAAYARGFIGPVLHMVFASIWGYYIGRAWLCQRNLVVTVIGSLALTAVLHGIYDFAVIGVPGPGLPIAAVLITGLWVWRLFLIRDLHEAYRRREPVCG